MQRESKGNQDSDVLAIAEANGGSARLGSRGAGSRRRRAGWESGGLQHPHGGERRRRSDHRRRQERAWDVLRALLRAFVCLGHSGLNPGPKMKSIQEMVKTLGRPLYLSFSRPSRAGTTASFFFFYVFCFVFVFVLAFFLF